MKNLKNTQQIIFFLIIIFISLVYLLSLDIHLGDFGGDNAQYILLARALSDGLGYRAINYPNSPLYTLVPPLFPILLTPIVFFFGYNFLLMHVLIVIFAAASLVLLYLLFKETLERNKLLLLIFLVGINPFLLAIGVRNILTEIPFIFFSLAAFLGFQRYWISEAKFNKYFFITVFLVCAACLTRNIGNLLPLAFLIFALLEIKNNPKAKPAILLSLLSFSATLLWILRKLLVATKVPAENFLSQSFMVDIYNQDLGFMSLVVFLKRLVINLKYCFSSMFGVVFPRLEDFAHLSLGGGYLETTLIILFNIILFFGLLRSLKKHSQAQGIFFLLYLTVLLFWHNSEIERYLLPILFLIVFYFLEGLYHLRDLNLSIMVKKIISIFVYALIIVSIFLNCAASLKVIKSWDYVPENTQMSNFLEANYWLKKNTDAKSIVISRKPTLTSLFSGHKSLVYPYTHNSGKIINYIYENKIKYVILDECFFETQRFLFPAVKINGRLFKASYRAGNTIVLEFLGF